MNPVKRTYRIIDGQCVEVTKTPRIAVHDIIPDINPYRSMITGEIIGSRSTHRLHLRDHNCIEVGNETDKQFHAFDDLHSHLDASRHETIVEQFRDMSEQDCTNMLKKAKQQSGVY